LPARADAFLRGANRAPVRLTREAGWRGRRLPPARIIPPPRDASPARRGFVAAAKPRVLNSRDAPAQCR